MARRKKNKNKTSNHSKKSTNKNLKILLCLFLIISSLIVYWQINNHDFLNYDDELYVTNNDQVKAGLTFKGITKAFTTFTAVNWQPVTLMSHMLDCDLFGLNPGAHHLVSLFFHIINTLLLFIIFERMTGKIWPSGFLAALFALHPLHVESVAWIAERKDVLSTFFWLLTMLSYHEYVKQPGKSRFFFTLLFFALGLMSKPMLVTLPFVLLLLDYWPLKRMQIDGLTSTSISQNLSFLYRLVWEKIPFFILSVASSIITYLAQKPGGGIPSIEEVTSLPERISNALVSYISYIGKMVWPSGLAVFYPYRDNIPLVNVILACIILLSITAVAIKMIKKCPYLTVGWFWYIGTLIPVIGLVQVGLQSMADRYTYIPLTGVFIMIVWGAADLSEKFRHARTAIFSVGTIVLIVIMVKTFFYLQIWENSITLFEHTVKVTPSHYVPHLNLGNALSERGHTKEAIEHYLKALNIKSDYAKAHYNLGSALKKQGRSEEAIKHYLKALDIKPDYAKAHYSLGNALSEQGHTKEAIEHYLKALQIDPDYAGAHNNLANVFARQGNLEKAIEHYLKVLQIIPDSAEAYNNLGSMLFLKNDIQGAISNYQKALHIKPNFTRARNNLMKALNLQQQRK